MDTKMMQFQQNMIMSSKFLCLLIYLHLSILLVLTSTALSKQRCHDVEKSALLELKRSFTYPIQSYFGGEGDDHLQPWKLESWKSHTNCCTWNGVKCNDLNGHVTEIDLCCTGLSASLDSNSSLFTFVHLQNLNLAYTDFNYSSIPPQIGNLSSLTTLNLSFCKFKGQIPPQISLLTNLSSLDLSDNSAVELLKPDLEKLSKSLTKLEHLHLSSVHMPYPLPDSLANLSSLNSLTLTECDLEGDFQEAIFNLPNLEVLDLSLNFDLNGQLPEFHWSSHLKSLSVYDTKFSGILPSSIGNLTRLDFLDLSFNNFHGNIPSFWNTTRITTLRLSYNEFNGGIPSSIGNLVHLLHLDLSSNQLMGPVPSQLGNLTQLIYLDLSLNKLRSLLPLSMFLKLTKLVSINLSFNNLSVVITGEPSHSSSLLYLNLAACNLHEFPKPLTNLEKLSFLDLSYNYLRGDIPLWFLNNVSSENLMYLNLAHNSLTEAGVFRWPKLVTLDLRFNNLQGLLPIPPNSVLSYRVSNNKLSGEIPTPICSLRYIQGLDLASNNFSGLIPECFRNLMETLVVFSLQRNRFSGRIPDLFKGKCTLGMIDFSENHFLGPLPRSLSGCVKLEYLNFMGNMIFDTFPSWLGSIPRLTVLILRANRFQGAIEKLTKSNSTFASLQILDLSHNDFQGRLPSEYWRSMTMRDPSYEGEEAEYLKEYIETRTALGDVGPQDYDFTMTIVNKGMEMVYPKIINYFAAIDLSSNNFSGEIPNSIASLKLLRLLNLSNNFLGGAIPPLLGDLINLEALDLSRNQLSGEIPQQLTQLTALAFFNVSCNRLFGAIPREKQFNTFMSNSYEGNEGLCGDPLSKKCEINNVESPPPGDEDSDTTSVVVIEWKFVVVGYASGFIIAVIIWNRMNSARQESLLRIFNQRCGNKTMM